MLATIIMFYCILVGMMLGAKASITLRELERKVNKIDNIEQNVEWLVKEFNYWKGQKINISEKLINEKFDTVENLEIKVNNLTSIANHLNRQVTDSQTEIARLQNLLEYGGQHVQTYPHNDTLQLKDQDELRLQFLGTRNAWLGCPINDVCDLRTCPSVNNYYNNFKLCWGEVFQIIGEGTQGSAIKSGQRIRLRYYNHNFWMGCPYNNRCEKRSCPGAQGRDFKDNRCSGEIFIIYARGRTNGQIIYNGDLVMLYAVNAGRYVSIQGQNEGDDTSLNFCPGVAPPPYLSYGMCIKDVFRVHRKP